MKKIVAIIFTLLFVGFVVLTIVRYFQFDIGCSQHLKRAADASSVETAKIEIEQAISYAEKHNLTEGIVSLFLKQPKNDVSFWYNNMVSAYEELEDLPEDSTPLERTNVLMKIRESLTDQKGNDVTVTVPDNLYLYPYNKIHFWGGIALFVLMVGSWLYCSLKRKTVL